MAETERLCGKVCLTDRKNAEITRNAVRRRRGPKTKDLFIYWCVQCAAYHLTKSKRGPDGMNR